MGFGMMIAIAIPNKDWLDWSKQNKLYDFGLMNI